MLLEWDSWRPLVLGLAVAFIATAPAVAEGLPLAERIQQCGTCHGDDGNSRAENVPSIAGQPEFFLLNQLFLMREGVRKIDAMAPFVKDLKDEDLTAMAAHFSKLTPQPSEERIDPTLVKRGAVLMPLYRCASCHRRDLAGQVQMPRLAKQRVDYMIHAMKELRDNKRSGADTQMTAVLVGVRDADIVALAHYAASR